MSDTSPLDPFIFKIFTPEDWATLVENGQSQGSPLDQTDGFLHFSTQSQLAATLALHFKGAGPLIVARIPISGLAGRDVRWEPARDGSLFPHLYGPLHQNDIDRDWPLHADPQGDYALPDNLAD